MPLISEPFLPQALEDRGFVRFGIVLSLSAVHQGAQDALFLGRLPPPEQWKPRKETRDRPALVWSRSLTPARAIRVGLPTPRLAASDRSGRLSTALVLARCCCRRRL